MTGAWIRRTALGAAAACVGIAIGGCSLHGALLGGVATQTTTATTTSAPATTPTGGAPAGPATGTGSATTAPTPTAPTTTTTPTSPSTASSTTTATSTTATTTLPGSNAPTIALGDENTPEQFVLGALYRIALSDQGYSVTVDQNIGTSAIAEQALVQGTLDLYPAYLNQWDSVVAGDNAVFGSVQDAYVAGETFAGAHSIDLLPPTPFSDTDGIAVTTQYARTNDLLSLWGLDHAPPPLALGAPLEFSVAGGGLQEIESAYGFHPSSVAPIDIGSQYGDLAAGTIQAAFVQTTDWQLGTGQFTLLRDPRHVLGFGNVVPVTTAAIVKAEGPDFAATIEHVDSLLTTSVMRGLDAAVQVVGETPDDVAATFLALNGILPPPSGT